MSIFQFGNTTRLVPLGLFIDLIADTHRSKALDFAKRTILLASPNRKIARSWLCQK